VCTANVLDTIPGPLLDRMEVIQLSGYVAEEKVAIAEKYLIPVAQDVAGLKEAAIHLHRDAVEALIREYCRESGVRNLKKHVDKIMRKAAYKIVEQVADKESAADKELDEQGEQLATPTDDTNVHHPVTTQERQPMSIPTNYALDIHATDLKDYVGAPVFTTDRLYETTPPGVVMGLAWTSMGTLFLFTQHT
jgi:Lon-like ATP-dependent protease